MQNTFKINSQYNNLINLKVTPGHFATTSSHINYMIDLTTLKARCSEAKAVAKSMASEYIATTVVDAIVCMDGTDHQRKSACFFLKNIYYRGSMGDYAKETAACPT